MIKGLAIILTILLFAKEYIVINQELIIYFTFILLTITAVKVFDFLLNIFSSVRDNTSSVLNLLALTEARVIKDQLSLSFFGLDAFISIELNNKKLLEDE